MAYNKIEKRELITIAKNVFRVRTLVGAVYLVQTDEGNILIDTGYFKERKKIIAQLKRHFNDELKIKAVLLTHAHPDHDGNCHYIKDTYGSEIIAHEKEYDYIMNPNRLAPLHEKNSPFLTELFFYLNPFLLTTY